MGKGNEKKWNFEAGTVEEAIEIALKKLNFSRDEIDVQVVCEEKKGLFGMDGAELAKIVVRKKE